MSNFFRYHTNDHSLIEAEFSNSKVQRFEVEQFGSKLIAFYCHFHTVADFSDYWLEWVSFLTGTYIIDYESKFEKRNTYVLFSCSEEIPKDLRFKIENNRFSVRKLVFNDYFSELSIHEVESFLSKKILLSDVELTEPESGVDEVELSKESMELLSNYRAAENEDSMSNDFFEVWLTNKMNKVQE